MAHPAAVPIEVRCHPTRSASAAPVTEASSWRRSRRPRSPSRRKGRRHAYKSDLVDAEVGARIGRDEQVSLRHLVAVSETVVRCGCSRGTRTA